MEKKHKRLGKKCFIITPIGDINSDIFRRASGVIENVIKPILKKYGFIEVVASYEIYEIGMLTHQITEKIATADLLIANLSGANPNVMYELCLGHVLGKPMLCLCENQSTLSFDIKDMHTIFYEDDMLGAVELGKAIEEYLKNINYNIFYKDNPILESQIIVEHIGKVVRNELISYNRFLTKMVITIVGMNDTLHEEVTKELDKLGFVELDYCQGINLEKCSVFRTTVSDFDDEWLYNKIKAIIGDGGMIKIERK